MGKFMMVVFFILFPALGIINIITHSWISVGVDFGVPVLIIIWFLLTGYKRPKRNKIGG
jgi:hypothetical protein